MAHRKNKATERKMSEMISEIGAGFISVGTTTEERQNRLNAVCSAWNMACGSPEERQRQLRLYGESYKRFHPATPTEDLAAILKDMKTLMDRKLRMFPDDHRQIGDARVVMVGESFRIECVSATLP